MATSSLPEDISYLIERATDFGNHFQKYCRNIRNFYAQLSESLESSGSGLTIRLHSSPNQYQKDFEIISQIACDEQTRLNNLGCYYAVQFLWFNIRQVDWLDYQLGQNRSRQRIYTKFLLNSGTFFRELTSAYMVSLIKSLEGENSLPRFFIAGVGTRSDQDDIDVGIIDDCSGNRRRLNHIIGRVGLEMVRFASNFHYHLSEHVGKQAYSASINEYETLLEGRIGNFIILTEMLGAARIIGDPELFKDFHSSVTDRYYFNGEPNCFHEGYLRGILGEIEDLSTGPLDPNFIHPKHDGLRIIKNLIYAYKTRYNVHEVGPWRLLHELKGIRPDFKPQFQVLERSLTFLEIFRYLYQQFVVQEESIPVSDNLFRNNLQRIACQMHYSDFGSYQAVYQLLQDYKNAVEEYRKILPVFIEDLTSHLHKSSVFKYFVYQEVVKYDAFEMLLEKLQFFRNVHYWDDFFSLITESDHNLRQSLLDDISRMDSEKQDHALTKFSDWVGINPEFLFRFVRILSEEEYLGSHEIINRLLGNYLEYYKNDFELLQKLVSLYYKKPNFVYQILQFCNTRNLTILENLIRQKSAPLKNSPHFNNFKSLVEYVKLSSHYFRRFISTFYEKYAALTCYMLPPKLLARESSRLPQQIPFIKSREKKKEVLGNYFDLQFLALGLESLNGLEVQKINRKFTRFSCRYFHELFRVCAQEILNKQRQKHTVLNNLAIYASGGMGREKAFEDDFDLIIISDTGSDFKEQLYREIISLMNTEIIKRGTLPHFRFSAYSGEYFIPFNMLKSRLQSVYSERYVDQSQLLEAKLLFGTQQFHKKFKAEIVEKEIFDDADEYIKRMIREIHLRHGSFTFFHEKCANIKECTGGLRDIEMIVLIFKVKFRLPETNPYALIDRIKQADPAMETQWHTIRTALLFLQRFRYIYRLCVAAENQIYPENLREVAKKLNPQVEDERAIDWLWAEFRTRRKMAWRAIHTLIRSLE